MTPSHLTPAHARHARFTRILVLILAVAGVMIGSSFAYFYVFSRPMSLDEGYLMITVQGFLAGHALYDTVFTQYGPFYYFYQWVARSVLHVPLTHDATRFLCITHWAIACLLFSMATRRITGSGIAGLFVGLASFVHLSAIAHEPGHPQELVVVMLGFGLLAATYQGSRWSVPALAITAVLLSFTKINVGLFFGFAVMLAMACHSTGAWARPQVRALLLAACAAIPPLLMRNHLPAKWCAIYAAIISTAAVLSLFASQRVTESGAIRGRHYAAAAIAALGCFGILLICSIATGTSINGLLDGLLLGPLKMPRVALLALPLSTTALVSAGVSVMAAWNVISRRHTDEGKNTVALLKALFGVTGALFLAGNPRLQLGWLLPWVWLCAIPAAGTHASAPQAFARVFLSIAAAWQGLQAYPIAGTQISLATVLLVVAFGVCLADALRITANLPSLGQKLSKLTPAAQRLGVALAGVALLFVFTNHWCKLPKVRAEFAHLPRLALPGSEHVRMDEETTVNYRILAAYLSEECDTFVCYPGVNSLYFWTGKRPPTQLNCTGWGVLSAKQQTQIIEAVGSAQRPKIVVAEAQMAGWNTPMYDPIRPFIQYVTEQCRPVKRIGRFIVFEPKRTMLSAANVRSID